MPRLVLRIVRSLCSSMYLLTTVSADLAPKDLYNKIVANNTSFIGNRYPRILEMPGAKA